MRKQAYPNIHLACTLQQADNLEIGQCHNGVITRLSNDRFLYEEAVRKGRPKRNPKLFDGEYCSLVHMQNGKYKIHMKSICASKDLDRQELAFKVYSELLHAFEILD